MAITYLFTQCYVLFLLQLNVLHWHITDTQSFPIKLEKFPETTGKMAQFGAYGPNHIYTVDQVKDLVQYATERGESEILMKLLSYLFRIYYIIPIFYRDVFIH